MSEPSDILEEARKIIYGRREQDYGPPKVNFQRIATGWSIIFGCDVTPQQVALGMIWLKTARLVENPFDQIFKFGLFAPITAKIADIGASNHDFTNTGCR